MSSQEPISEGQIETLLSVINRQRTLLHSLSAHFTPQTQTELEQIDQVLASLFKPDSPIHSQPPRLSSIEPERLSQVFQPPTLTDTQASVLATIDSFELNVAGSSVRPDEKGRAVLSYIIIISHRTTGQEAWRVRKLYSDILTLDQVVK
jgi:hypothetical protein